MSNVMVVENPRRRKRRAKRRPARRRTRRRRNPSVAALTNPRRRRRTRSSSAAPRRRRRYSNPSLGGFGRNLTAGVDIGAAAFVAGGMVLVRVGPGLIAKVWKGVPRTGVGGYAVKFGVVLVAGYGTQLLTKSPARRNQVIAGALGMLLFDAFNEFVAPKIGLSGMGQFVKRDYRGAALNRGNGGAMEGFVNRRNAGSMPNGYNNAGVLSMDY